VLRGGTCGTRDEDRRDNGEAANQIQKHCVLIRRTTDWVDERRDWSRIAAARRATRRDTRYNLDAGEITPKAAANSGYASSVAKNFIQASIDSTS